MSSLKNDVDYRLRAMRTLKFFKSCIFLITGMLLFSCTAKTQPDNDLADRIDRIFRKWDSKDTPGAAVAILKDGEFIFKKGYGMANMEYGIPITPSTIFHIASDSKQFTSFCMILLEQQGKLSLDADIRKYLPELPGFGKKISIRNLIYHTSGLRDQWQLLTISGTRLDDVITQDHIMKMVNRQERLNFDPGERHMYCNTGYTLMAEIVERVSGMSLRQFAEKEIFSPLNMRSTHFHDNYKEIVRNRAYSYDQKNRESFENSVLSYSTVGATGLQTTIEDAGKWLNNFTTATVGGRAAIDEMYERGTLNSGDTLSYAFGLYIDSYKGWKRIGHGGVDAGFRTYMVRFPEKDLGIIIFANCSDVDPWSLAMEIADLFLEGKGQSDYEGHIDDKLFAGRAGKYLSDEGMVCELVDSTNTRWLKVGRRLERMVPLTDTTFSIRHGQSTVIFSKRRDDSFVVSTKDYKETLRKYEPTVLSRSNFERYVGVYANKEVDTRYEIAVEDNKLILRHSKYGDYTLTPITNNQFSTKHWGMRNLIFKRDKSGKVIGFEVNGDRVLHLLFTKTHE